MNKEVLKLALEALECTEYPQDHYDAITALREALAAQPAQPRQEAWEHHAKKLTHWLYCMSYSDSYFGEPAGLVKQVTGELNRLIGTSPPAQRTWVSLTDIEIQEIWFTHLNRNSQARAIEAKLKEKNNG